MTEYHRRNFSEFSRIVVISEVPDCLDVDDCAFKIGICLFLVNQNHDLQLKIIFSKRIMDYETVPSSLSDDF